jgi:DNA-binding transcriptional regulator YdaS (Cro superfamily)
MTNIQIAIDYFGSQAALARAMNLNPMAVTQWKRRGLPPKRAKEISNLTNGIIKPADLLPCFFENDSISG